MWLEPLAMLVGLGIGYGLFELFLWTTWKLHERRMKKL
jgi:hypothetical protein